MNLYENGQVDTPERIAFEIEFYDPFFSDILSEIIHNPSIYSYADAVISVVRSATPDEIVNIGNLIDEFGLAGIDQLGTDKSYLQSEIDEIKVDEAGVITAIIGSAAEVKKRILKDQHYFDLGYDEMINSEYGSLIRDTMLYTLISEFEEAFEEAVGNARSADPYFPTVNECIEQIANLFAERKNASILPQSETLF